MNGLTNALKFCRTGSIRITLAAEADNVVVTVDDDGLGFEETLLPKLLQPFTKVASDSPGAGLGLFITKGLIEQMGGKLVIHSAVGQGTSFQAILPIALGKASKSAHQLRRTLKEGPKLASARRELALDAPGLGESDYSADPSPEIETTGLKPLRVLIADDNAVCRKLLQMAMKKASQVIQTREADDGLAAQEVFAAWQPHVVITDIEMPRCNGIEAAGKMRELSTGRVCRIYAITGLGSSDPRMKAAGINGRAALDGWLIKGKDMLKEVYGILDEVEKEREESKQLA